MPKPKKKSPKQVRLEIAALMADAARELGHVPELSPKDRRAKQLSQLPWRNNYSNWCEHVSDASGRYGSRIDYGETYKAWESGISPDAYALAHRRGA